MGNSLAEIVLSELVAINIAASVAILVVIAVRKPAQKMFGAGRASWLWLAPLAAGIACLLPRPEAPLPPLVVQEPMPMFTPPPMPTIDEVPVIVERGAAPINWSLIDLSLIDWAPILVGIWLGGAALYLIAMLWRQARMVARFGELTSSGDGLMRGATAEGPAVIGFLRTLLVVPADFETRYSEREREMVVAHERAHIAAQHTRINTLLVVLQALAWFNPLAHVAARLIRADQEFACDAAVAARFPGEKRTYGEALLKTQLGLAPPMGCAWPSRSASFLEARVRLLAAKPAGRGRRLAGAGLLLAAALAGGAAVWAAQPEEEPQEPGADEFVVREIERPSEQALAAFVGEQQRMNPGFMSRFEGPKGENNKIQWAVRQDRGLSPAWIPDGKIVVLDITAKIAGGGELKLDTMRVEASTAPMPESKGTAAPFINGYVSVDVLRGGVIDTDFTMTIDGRSTRVDNLKLRSGEIRNVTSPTGDGFVVSATLRDMTEKERASRERLRSQLVANLVKQRNDWETANPGQPYRGVASGRMYTPEEREAMRRPASAEEDKFLAGPPSEIPDGYVVEASETLSFAGDDQVQSRESIGFDDQFQSDLVNLPTKKKYTSSTRYRANSNGQIEIEKIFLLDGLSVAQPKFVVESGKPFGLTANGPNGPGLDYKATFTLRRMTAIEKSAYDGYMMGNKRLPDPDSLPPGTEPRPRQRMAVREGPFISLSSTGAAPVSKLMPRISDEEQDKQVREEAEEMMRVSPPRGMTKEQIEEALKNPWKMTPLDRARRQMFDIGSQLRRNMPVRMIPAGQLVETRVSVQLPGGERMGPFRMFNSSSGSGDSLEAADGLFGSDGNERFVGQMLSTRHEDGTIEMVMALVIDRQPILLGNVKAKSGESAEFTAEGGYRLTVQPVLRTATPAEAQNIERRRTRHVHESLAAPRPVSPETTPAPTPVPQSAPAPRQPQGGGLIPIRQEGPGAAGPVSRLMQPMSDAEQDATRQRMLDTLRTRPPADMTPEQIESVLNAPPPTPLERIWRTHTKVWANLAASGPKQRHIPAGHIIDVSMTAQLPSGEKLGPFRMYNSLTTGMTTSEFANGDEGFAADGGERFVGAVQGDVGTDGVIDLGFALVIDGQPLLVTGVKAKSGSTTEVRAEGGYRLSIRTELRPFTEREKKKDDAWKAAQARMKERAAAPASPPAAIPQSAPARPQQGGGLTPIRFQEQPPAEQQPRFVPVPTPRPDAPLVCDEWNSIWGGDPVVQFEALKRETPVRVTFADMGMRIDVSAAASAFPREHFPAGLAEGRPETSRMSRDTASYRVTSKTLVDTFTFAGLESERPTATWHRLRIGPDGPHDIFMEGRCRK